MKHLNRALLKTTNWKADWTLVYRMNHSIKCNFAGIRRVCRRGFSIHNYQREQWMEIDWIQLQLADSCLDEHHCLKDSTLRHYWRCLLFNSPSSANGPSKVRPPVTCNELFSLQHGVNSSSMQGNSIRFTSFSTVSHRNTPLSHQRTERSRTCWITPLSYFCRSFRHETRECSIVCICSMTTIVKELIVILREENNGSKWSHHW